MVCLFADFDSSGGGHGAVELLRVVGHSHGQHFGVAAQGQVVRYTPRVPAGAASAKGHDALGHQQTKASETSDTGVVVRIFARI
jgi:hypothetical protein